MHSQDSVEGIVESHIVECYVDALTNFFASHDIEPLLLSDQRKNRRQRGIACDQRHLIQIALKLDTIFGIVGTRCKRYDLRIRYGEILRRGRDRR